MALQSIGEEIWIADGPVVSFYGFPYPTRMAVIRLADGALWVWSPIRLEPALHGEVAALGPVRHLVSPNKLHHLFLGEWVAAWPKAGLYAPPGLARRRRDLHFTGELGDWAEPAWQGQIDQAIVGGSLVMDEVLFFHRRSSTCLVCDLIQRHDPAGNKGIKGLLMRFDGLVGRQGSTPREWRATFIDRRSAREAARRALSWQPERLVIAHGQWAPSGGTEVLTRGLAWLKP